MHSDAHNAKELVVISGKGGTGKTSIVASFAALADACVVADCDVDAADLHLVLEPTVMWRAPFSGGSKASIRTEDCHGCGTCMEVCRFGAVTKDPTDAGTLHIDPIACEGCGVCAWFCPSRAISFAPAVHGEWFVSETRVGAMVHAALGIAESNSGKLVSVVREQARAIARENRSDLVLIDGSPGIGCPVIASLTGADLALVVTEPTPSGLHDLMRVLELTQQLHVRTLVCVNKWDVHAEMTSEIETLAQRRGATIVGRVRYDRAVTDAQTRRSRSSNTRSTEWRPTFVAFGMVS